MMGLGKPQRFANFEGAGFICYGNIREFVFKNWSKPKRGNPLLFGGTDFTVGFADPMFSNRCATVAKILKGNPQFWEAPLTHGPVVISIDLRKNRYRASVQKKSYKNSTGIETAALQ